MSPTNKSGVVDRAKLRAMLRKQPRQTIYSMLDEAVGLLPKAKLEQLVARYLSVQDLRPDAPPSASATRGLRAEVEAFAEASRRGDDFEAFNVNSKNCTEESNGTSAWIAECNRLLDRCVARANARSIRVQTEVLGSFDILFELIDQAASCDLDSFSSPMKPGSGRLASTGGPCCRRGSAALPCMPGTMRRTSNASQRSSADKNCLGPRSA